MPPLEKNILTAAGNFQIVQNVKINFHRMQAGNGGRVAPVSAVRRACLSGARTVAVAGVALVVRTTNLEKQP